MGRRVLDSNALNYITIFESATGAKIKDCLIDNGITFVVEKGNMGLAIGKGAQNLRRAERILKKSISILEFNDDPCEFLRSLLPVKDVDIKKEERKLLIYTKDAKTKGKIMGRERTNLAKLKSLVKRFFDIEEIVVN